VSDKFIIKNPAQLQVFTTLFSAALIGVVTSRNSEGNTPGEMVRRADQIACAAVKAFEGHFPPSFTDEDKPLVVVPLGKQPK